MQKFDILIFAFESWAVTIDIYTYIFAQRTQFILCGILNSIHIYTENTIYTLWNT